MGGRRARPEWSQSTLIGGLSGPSPGVAVLRSPAQHDKPLGREAGESPAQSRYGDHRSDGGSPVADPRRLLDPSRERVGIACDPPADRPSFDVEARGLRFRGPLPPHRCPETAVDAAVPFRPLRGVALRLAALLALIALTAIVFAACSTPGALSSASSRTAATASMLPP